MKRTILFCSMAFLISSAVFAEEKEQGQDTIRTHYIDEVVVTSSVKETNPMETFPGSVSLLSSAQIEAMQVENIKGISSIVPNFFIPDYGSKMTSPVYIRGIGNRSTGQAVGMYVNNAPYLNKSTFDFEFMDIQRIEVLRGPQGTLFGRNSMGGIINIFTPSPLQYQGTKFALSAGNDGLLKAKASNYSRINEDFGVSIGGYYDKNDGYFNNVYTGKKADEMNSGGGQLRFDWKIEDSFRAYLLMNYDYVDQGAFPYGAYDKTTGVVSPVSLNDESDYLRKLFNGALNMEYRNEHILLSSATSYQTLNDNMHMDQDFTAEPVYTLNQKQEQQVISQEFSIKSNHKKNYQWSFGVYGFQDQLTTRASVEMKKLAIQRFIQPNFPAFIQITDTMLLTPGVYETPDVGGAVYHQSTYNNLFIEGLSITAGIRLDYEKDKLNYDSDAMMNLMIDPPGPIPPSPMKLDTLLRGSESMEFTEILPKVSLKYAFGKDRKDYVYISAAKGYNPGGYNVQIFSKLMEEALMIQARPGLKPTVTVENAAYDPEYSWNYELGFKGEVIKDVLSVSASLFYIRVDDMQLTKFIEGGEGRMLANVGKSENKGFELELNARIASGLYAGVNYGYTHAKFKDYNYGHDIDYSGKYVPYAPQQTLSVYGSYLKTFRNKWIDKLHLNAQYNAAGKIYWTEANDIYQDFYGLLNLKAGFTKKAVTLNLWGKNVLDTDYNAFYFQSSGNSFFQKGRPLTFGADLIVSF